VSWYSSTRSCVTLLRRRPRTSAFPERSFADLPRRSSKSTAFAFFSSFS